MLSRVSITITCSAYGSSAPTLVENTAVLNAWCLVNVLMHLIMNGNKNVIDKNQEQQVAQSAMGLSRLRLTTVLISDAAFWVFIANTDLLNMWCQGKMFLHNSQRFHTIYCKTLLQRFCQVVLTSQSSVSLAFVPIDLFHISIMCSVFDILWRQVCGLQVSGASIGQSQPQEFKHRFKTLTCYPKHAGRNAQESHLHTGLKDCRRPSHDGRVPSCYHHDDSRWWSEIVQSM